MQRLLLVHAHPDDEVIGTGASIAKYAAAGVEVTLVTCTMGEEGEVIGEEQAHRVADREDSLGEYRKLEMAEAVKALNITRHLWLGGEGKYRDSGMMGTPANDKPGTFWGSSAEDTTYDITRILREVRPDVIVTYDAFGGYGHPDHIRAHQTAVAGFDAAADPEYAPELGEPHQVSKLYYTAIPKSWLQAGIDAMKASGQENFFEVDSADDLPFGVADEDITTIVSAAEFIENKFAAMRAHATQIEAEGGFFALSDGIGKEVMGAEAYILARGASGPLDDEGHETDLFAGL